MHRVVRGLPGHLLQPTRWCPPATDCAAKPPSSAPAAARPTDHAEARREHDVLTDFVTDDGTAMGRPVGVAVDVRGALLVADDVGNVVWRVHGAGAAR